MKLLYGEEKFFIGAVKFFDASKDFGFIASNNCNMPTPKYNQDFYELEKSKLFISSGLGVDNGFRLFCRPSINFFRLSNQ